MSIADKTTCKNTKVLEIGRVIEYENSKIAKKLFLSKLDKDMNFSRKNAGKGRLNCSILPKDEKDDSSKCIRDKNSFLEHQIT